MYSILPSFVLGFHGCDASVAESIFAGLDHLRPSRNEYDWLGDGVYFWENSPARAREYATLVRKRTRKAGARIKNPAVVGAVIDLGNCLNLLDVKFLDVLRDGYQSLLMLTREAGVQMPHNRRAGPSRDLLLRNLDCAVINTVHQTREEKPLLSFDTVRAAFIEGEPLYPGSSFRNRNHIQICVRNRRCIKGYFRPMEDTEAPQA